MAFAHPGPAADHVSSPDGVNGLTAGSGTPPAVGSETWPVDLTTIARRLAASAGDLTPLRGQAERSWIRLASTHRFEAWAIGWPPGGRIALHDHGSANGVVAVAAGTLTETNARVSRRGTVVIGTQRIRAGEHREFGAGYVHDLTNDDDDEAISVHVYAPHLSTMHYYELNDRGRLVIVRSEHTEPIGSSDATGVFVPS
jgi:hypothetical protein